MSENYNDGNFRFWCQKVLPLVYDDSLSYYELINKVVEYLNNAISDIANTETNLTALYNSFVALQSYINNIFGDGDLEQYVDNWLNDHPEVTTTVMDGSLTEAKFTNDLKLKTIKDYVTPQMYGAKGDGVADDTTAIQSAINSGKDVYIPAGTYKTSTTINIDFQTNFSLNGSGAIINYSGADYAFLIRRTQYSEIRFGEINAPSGGCIKIFTARLNNQGEYQFDYVQYTDIYFNQLSSLTDCVFMNSTERGWLNEIRFFGGRLASGECGVKYVHNSANGTSHNSFFNIGIEGVSKGFNFIVDSAAEAEGKYFTDFEFYNLRTAETNNIFTTVGKCTRFLVVGAYTVNVNKTVLSAESDMWLIITPGQLQYVDGGVIRTIDQMELIRKMNYTDLVAGDDLNDFTIVGSYTCRNTATARELLNSPVQTAFNMSVTAIAGVYQDSQRYRYLMQELNPLNLTGTFYRRFLTTNDYGANWTIYSWYVFSGTQVT